MLFPNNEAFFSGLKFMSGAPPGGSVARTCAPKSGDPSSIPSQAIRSHMVQLKDSVCHS